MTQVILTKTLRSMLPDLNQPLELCDESGQIVARVFPMLDLSQYEPLEPRISNEEMERRLRSNEKRYTTAEVLAYLEKL